MQKVTLKQCYMTNSTCYKQTTVCNKFRGIVVHDTGAGNPTLKRYVQPLVTDANYAIIINDLGINKYGNDWNHRERKAGVHAFIGKNEKGEVETYEVLPPSKFAWGVGKGEKGSYNFEPAYYQFEICDDSSKGDYSKCDKEYFTNAFNEAISYCAYLCVKFLFNPLTDILSHHECYLKGYGNNHGDCDVWLKQFDKDMNWFRKSVNDLVTKDYPYQVYNANTELVAYCTSLVDAKKYSGCSIYLNGELIKTEREQIYETNSADKEIPVDNTEEIIQPTNDTISSPATQNILSLIIACVKAIIAVIKGWKV